MGPIKPPFALDAASDTAIATSAKSSPSSTRSRASSASNRA